MEEILNDLVRVSIDFERYLSERAESVGTASESEKAGAKAEARRVGPELLPPANGRTERREAEQREAKRQKAERREAKRREAERQKAERREAERREAGRKAPKQRSPRKKAPGAAREPGRSSEQVFSALEALHPRFPDLEREILYFKQLFYDLYIPRGALYLIGGSSQRAISEKRRLLGYFEELVSYSRGVTLRIGGGMHIDVLGALAGELLRFWASLRRTARRRFSLEFRRAFASRQALLAACNPEILELFGLPYAGQAGAVPDPESGEYAVLFEQVIRFIVDRYRPVLLLLDDVRALNLPGRRLLERTAPLISDLPVLIIGFIP